MRDASTGTSSIALLMLGSAPPAWYDEFSEAPAREARSARFSERGARTLPIAGFRFATAPELKAILGIARDREDAGTKLVTTPFSLTYKTEGVDWLKFQLVSDGYARVYEPGQPSLADLADITLNVSRPLWSPSWTGLAGVTLPTGATWATPTPGST